MEQKEACGLVKALLLAGEVAAIVLGGIDLLAAGFRRSGLEAVRPIVAAVAGVIALGLISARW